jgi:hypothetical protein
MVTIETYREIIKQVLKDYAHHEPVGGDIEMETIFDDAQGRYELVALGWQNKRRVHGSVIHIDVKAAKVWLQHDSTDADIARTLVERGIPPEHIVLGFHPPRYRQHTGFAVA